MSTSSPARQLALERFRQAGGVLRTAQATGLGIHPRTLYQLRDQGRIEQLSRGVYRLADLPAPQDPDFITVAVRVPKAVICLISALSFHGMTTEIPHEISIALPRATKQPHLDHPPLRVFWYSPEAHRAGIETCRMDGVEVRLYNPAKCVADCFKFRSKLGIDVAVEALRTGLEERLFTPAELDEYARICRVDRVMAPYLEALL